LPKEEFGQPHGLKVAHHWAGSVADPDNVNRQPARMDEEDLLYALNKYLPGAFQSWAATKVCLYSNTPDENFIIDKLPGFDERVVIACGFSGHGFKFASVIGEILAELALEGRTRHPIGFLSVKRFL
jgi:glycine/D-amino acid oxidase-like deaminating enzyme